MNNYFDFNSKFYSDYNCGGGSFGLDYTENNNLMPKQSNKKSSRRKTILHFLFAFACARRLKQYYFIGPKLHILTKYQYSILKNYFEQDPYWSKDTVAEVVAVLGLSRAKVLKWGSDKKRSMVRKLKIKQTSYGSDSHNSERDNNQLDCDVQSVKGNCGSVFDDDANDQNLNSQVDEIIDLCQNQTNFKIKAFLNQNSQRTDYFKKEDLSLNLNGNIFDSKNPGLTLS